MKLGGLTPGRTEKCEAWKIIGLRLSYPGGSGCQLRLCPLNVGPAFQQIRGNARGHVGRRRRNLGWIPELNIEGSWVLSRQNAESMNGQGDAALKRGYLGAHGLQLRFGLRHISLRLLTCLRQRPSETQRVLCDRDILFRDGETELEAARLRVESAHISQNGNQDVSPVLLGGSQISGCCLHFAADPAEYVCFPRRIE